MLCSGLLDQQRAIHEMSISLDRAFGIHDQALLVRASRGAMLAQNLAHADTPNYKARDFDFRAVLADVETGAAPAGRVRITHSRHIDPGSSGVGLHRLMYRQPSQASVDGNTVDAHAEKSRFVENAVRYQASLTFLNSKISGLRTALRGE